MRVPAFPRSPIAVAAAIAVLLAPALGAQQIIVGRAGPRSASSVLERELAAPHVVIGPDSAAANIPADSSYSTGVLVLGRDVTVNGTVHGDVAVIGGDLYLHPGAHVDGRTVAIGGAVYNSSLAMVGGAQESYRDFTYVATPLSSGYILDYESLIVERRGFSVPSWLGFSAPGYDRTDGLSLPIAINLSSGGPVDVQPMAIYRSELGRVDPSVDATIALGTGAQLLASAGRATLTNDGWIRSDVANSVEALVLGNDARNYYRGTFASARYERHSDLARGTLDDYLGARVERDRSVRPTPSATGGPWSILEAHETDHMLRPNPQVPSGDLMAVEAGASIQWTFGAVTAAGSLNEEVSHFKPAPGAVAASSGISQTTADLAVTVPTGSSQRLIEHAHVVATAGGATPQERYVYLGGSGTISTLDMLSLGGDELAFLDSRYLIPVSRVQLPIAGAPVLILRHVIGAAGVRGLPRLEQALGIRVAVSALYGEIMVDPSTHHAHIGAGVSLSH